MRLALKQLAVAVAAIGFAIAPVAAPAAPELPSQVTAACRGINWLPEMVPDVNGGDAWHFTFTMSQLLSQMQMLCQAQAQTQMSSIDFQTLPGIFENQPNQLGQIYTASNTQPPALANTGQATAVLGQLQGDSAMVQEIERMMQSAEGRDEHEQLTTMLTAAEGDELTKLLSLQASNVEADRAQTLQAASYTLHYLSGASPDMGDGYMI